MLLISSYITRIIKPRIKRQIKYRFVVANESRYYKIIPLSIFFREKFKVEEIIDTKPIDNVIEKLLIFMRRNNETMFGLANVMGFSYQPFYRFMTKKSLPTMGSLDSIAKNLNCTISELTSNNIFLDIPSYKSIEDYLAGTKPEGQIRVYLPTSMLEPMIDDKFIVINVNSGKEKTESVLNGIPHHANTNLYQLFSLTNRIHIDGFFWVKYKNKLQILDAISISSTIIIANYKNEMIKIPVPELEAFAKFISYVELPNQSQLTLGGALL